MALVLTLIAVVLAALVTGVVVAHLVTTRLRAQATAERHETVRAAVDSVVHVASTTLGDAVAANARELDVRSHGFAQQVDHIGDALQTLGGLVADLQKERASQTGSLEAQLREVSRTQQALADHTQQLRQALASPKQRGQWGERMAEDVLAAAGLREGVSYVKQTAVAGGRIPDFRFVLPHDLELRMDVKFPVDNYLRVLDAGDDADAVARHTRAFVADVRTHVKSLAGRGYVDPRDTVDCVLLFIPNEAVFSFLHESDAAVVDVALEHRVVLCSPSTLFAVLAVVRRSVEQFQLERRSDEILRCLGGIVGEWDKFGAALDKVGKQLDTVTRSFHDELNGTRRRVFQRALDEVVALPEPPGDERADGDALAARKAAGDVRPLPSAG